MVAQDDISSCATEQKLVFLLRVLWAGTSSQESVAFVAKCGDLLGCATLVSVRMSWIILLCLISSVDCLDDSTLGAKRLGFTLGENTGRGEILVGSLSGASLGGRVLSSMWLFLLILLGICCEEIWCVVLARALGVVERKDGEDAT